MPTAELRPMTAGEIMNTAVRIYATQFLTLMSAVAIFIIPVEILYAVWFAARSNGALVSVLLLVVTGQLATAASLQAVAEAYLGVATSWRRSIAFVSRRMGRVLLLALIEVALVGVGSILIIPGVYLLVALLVATPALLFERLDPISAMKRSRELVRGLWFRTAGCYLLASFFVGLVALIPTLLFIKANGSGAHVTSSHPLAAQIAGVVTSLLTTPFMAAIVVLIYFDLRVRKEGYRLDDLAKDVAIEPGQIDRARFDRRDDPPFPNS